MYYIAICDNKKESLQYMRRLIESSEYGKEVTFYEYPSGEALIGDMQEREKYDLLILDIQLEGMDGYQTAKVFREHFPDTLLVFCSGVYSPTPESFEVTPYRYLLKSYTEERMKNELAAVLKKMQENHIVTYVFGKKENELAKINVKDIWYIELARRKSILHCHLDRKEVLYASNEKLEELHEQLVDSGFCYAHNSYLVNLQHVVTVGAKELQLDVGTKLTIARSKAKEFKELFIKNASKKYE